jgi:hypothetical protein
MGNEIVAFARARARAAVRRAAVPAAFAVVGALFVLFAVAGLFAALFFWLEPTLGPISACLIVAAVALLLAIIAFLPLALRRKQGRPPADAALPQFISLLARSAPSVAPRHVVATAALVAVALLFSARGQKK